LQHLCRCIQCQLVHRGTLLGGQAFALCNGKHKGILRKGRGGAQAANA
jgi:hypothetical protein